MRLPIEIHGFRTTAGRRMTLLFLFAAVLPMSWVSLEAYHRVDAQLKQQARSQVHWVTAAAATAVLDRLRLAETELDLATRLTAGGGESADMAPTFRVLDRVNVALPRVVSAGARGTSPAPRSRVPGRSGRFTGWRIVTSPSTAGTRVWLGHSGSDDAWVWASLRPQSLIATARIHSEGPGTLGVCLLLPEGQSIACDATLPRAAIAAALDSAQTGGPAGLVVVKRAHGAPLWLGFRTLFLRGRYSARPWVVVTAFDQASLLTPVTDFQWTFPRILLVVVALVLLVSGHQIQRNLQPLEALSAASRRIEQGDLEARVPVAGRDEFGAVAGAFNRMAARVARQVGSLQALRRLDQAVLARPTRDALADAVLDFGAAAVPSDAVAVWLSGSGDGDGVVHSAMAGNSAGKRCLAMPRARLESPASGELAVTDTAPPWAAELSPFRTEPFRRFLTVAAGGGRQDAVLLLASRDPAAFAPDSRPAALQLGEQVALAISTVQLVEQLAQADAGSLAALSRSMDLVSPWTAGHAERVATLSVAMGRHLGLGTADLERLQKGALLHDIGMFGVPPGLMERTSRLTARENEKLRDHVTLGARVLEPIAAFTDILPLVAQHHERWDGTGYPAGLSGEAIHPLARIVAVADEFDDLTSQRPDHERLNSAAASARIRDAAGTAFEPRVADALLAVLHLSRQALRQQVAS